MALAASLITERKRVKVYELRENDWFDRGTGFCAVQTINNDGRIFVESEDEPDRSLLEVKVKKEDNYQKQQDTLIVWTDPEGVDMALSFQEAEGCGIVWSTISEVQQRLTNGQGRFSRFAVALSHANLDISPDDTQGNQLMLPPAELKYLPDIEALIRGAGGTQQGRETLAKLIISENYMANLTALVEIAEDLEDLPDLHRLCNIMKTLILFNDHAIIEYAVRDDIIFGVVGALEYDPDFPKHKANHRQYLADESKFKEVVRIQDDHIRGKIHTTYRLQYLKDVVLARILDDPTFSVLNSLIYFHQIDIVQHITGNTTFINELFSVITDPKQPQQRKKEAVVFVQQCCTVAKPFNGPTRAQLYQNFVSYGLFPAIAFALQHHDASVRVAGTDILVAVIDHDVTMIRNYIYKAVNDGTKPLTDTLIELLLVESDLGVKAQVADAIKVLLEPITAPPVERGLAGDNGFAAKLRSQAVISQQNDQFLQSFFDQSAKKLFQPLKDLERRKSMSGLSIHEVSLYSHLVEILCFFIRQHSYRSKIFILSEGIASRTAQLMTCPEKHMKLTAIKYFRAVLNLNDEHHNRQMIQHRLFEPILNILIETMPRDNLLNSACLDLFEFIRKENIKPIILHLSETYRERLQNLSSAETFAGILLRYDQFMNPESATQSTNPIDIDSSLMTSDTDTPNTRHVTINGGATRWQGLKDPDAEEDAYFNASDGEDDDEDELSRDPPLPQLNGASPLAKPLVDYADDDDEEWPVAPLKQSTILDDLTSSPTPTPSTTASSTPALAPAPAPPPSTSLAEKRRREEDDDEDELGKLSVHNSAKRRNSSTSASSAGSEVSWDFVRSAAERGDDFSVFEGSSAEKEMVGRAEGKKVKGQEVAEEEEKPPIPTRASSLRRKKALSGLAKEKEKVKEQEKEKEKDVAGSGAAATERGAATGAVAGRKIAFNLSKSRERDKDKDKGLTDN